MRQFASIPLALAISAAALGGCDADAPRPAQAGPRVVSLTPAVTAMMFDMGFGEHVVGVTRFCKLPDGVERPSVGDALTLDTESVLAIEPDVIFTQSRPEKFRGVVDVRPSVRVVQLRLEELADIPAAMRTIGEAIGKGETADTRAAAFEAKIAAVRAAAADKPRPDVLFVMGTDRPSVTAEGTFVGDLIEAAGGRNAARDIPGRARWRSTQIEAILKAAPDVVICQVLDPAEAPAAEAYWCQWDALPAARTGRVFVVTDPGWTIPSPRLAELAEKLAEMIHPPRQQGLAVPGRPRMQSSATTHSPRSRCRSARKGRGGRIFRARSPRRGGPENGTVLVLRLGRGGVA